MKKSILAAIGGLFLTLQSFSQITDFSCTFEMTMSSTDEEVQAGLSQMGPSKMVMTFFGKSFKSEMTNLFMNQKTIYNESQEKGMMLSEMMGKKSAVNMTKDELEEKSKKEQGLSDDSKVEKFEEFKEILGYKCQKVKVTSKNSTVTMYVTNEIKPVVDIKSEVLDKVEGYALETVTESVMGGRPMTITLEAKNLKTEIKDKDQFALTVPKGYKAMTYTEYMNQMKAFGMGGGE